MYYVDLKLDVKVDTVENLPATLTAQYDFDSHAAGHEWMWKTRDGTWIPIKSMSDSHLTNALRMIARGIEVVIGRVKPRALIGSGLPSKGFHTDTCALMIKGGGHAFGMQWKFDPWFEVVPRMVKIAHQRGLNWPDHAASRTIQSVHKRSTEFGKTFRKHGVI